MKRKYELNLYAPFQYEDIQSHLEEMAERGWALEKASHRLFVYQAAEPGPVRYALAYRPEVGWMDQLPTQGQEIYAGYCQDAGWELVDTWARYPQIQIYRSRMRYPVPLETDLTTHWQVLTTWMDRRYIEPLRSNIAIGSLFAMVTAMLLTIFLTQGEFEPPISFLCIAAAVLLVLLVLHQLIVLVDAQRWLEEARRASEEGSPGPRGRMSLPWKITFWVTAAAGVGTLALFVGIAVSDHGTWRRCASPGRRWCSMSPSTPRSGSGTCCGSRGVPKTGSGLCSLWRRCSWPFWTWGCGTGSRTFEGGPVRKAAGASPRPTSLFCGKTGAGPI